MVSDNCTPTPLIGLSWNIIGSGAVAPFSGTGSIGTHDFGVGVSTVTFTATDTSGNTAMCSYTVTVANTLTGSITGTATVGQNTGTTSNITFSGTGGSLPYTFTYSVSNGTTTTTNSVSTTGSNTIVTVPQSNAVLGTFTYTLLSVTSSFGCVGTIAGPNTATITVVSGTPDLAVSQFFTTTQVAPGGQIQEVIGIRNIGSAPTSAPVVFTVSGYFPVTGLTTISNNSATATVGFTTYTLTNTADWNITISGVNLVFTSKPGVIINPGGANTKFVGVNINRAAGANASFNASVVIASGTGGGETPVINNNSSNTLLKN